VTGRTSELEVPECTAAYDAAW